MDIAIITVLGLILGSFATALIYRIPRDLPWRGATRSACPHCKHVLSPRDLIPFFSWLVMRGKCRYCGAKIAWVYPLAELGVVFACLGVFAAAGLTPISIFIILAVPILAALLTIDLEYFILPNELVAILACLGLMEAGVEIFYAHDIMTARVFIIEYALGAIIYAGLAWALGIAMTKILKRDALGFGDVKFFAVAGLWLGLSNLAYFCVLSGALGVILGFFWKTVKRDDVFPFGPALIMSFYLLLIFSVHS